MGQFGLQFNLGLPVDFWCSYIPAGAAGFDVVVVVVAAAGAVNIDKADLI